MKRIICIGNRFIPEDKAGYEVYQNLKKRKLPLDLELIDGGLAGLDLLRFIEGAERIIFVDAVSGFGAQGEIRLFEAEEVAALADREFDHSAGLPYLLRVLPGIIDGECPQIFLLGIEGVPNKKTIDKASSLALQSALMDYAGKEFCYD